MVVELSRSSLYIACLTIDRDASAAAVEFGELESSRVNAPSKTKQLSAAGDSIVQGPSIATRTRMMMLSRTDSSAAVELEELSTLRSSALADSTLQEPVLKAKGLLDEQIWACGEGPFDASSQTIDVSPIILVFDPPSCPAPGIT
eukprot:CCRYP_008735-RA/>CCRYP_008735-RA protein AED:0.40 eAED:0.47 QI:585/0/0.5/1/0/0/4/0/144